MPKLPVLSGGELIRLLEKDKFEFVRQQGSHVSLRKGELCTVVPLHDELSRGTLMDIMRQCNISRERLFELLEK